MVTRTRTLLLGSLVVAVFALTGAVVLALGASADGAPPEAGEGPDPTARDRARKEEEARQAAASVAPSEQCPVSREVCDLGVRLQAQLQSRAVDDLLAGSRPTRLECPGEPLVAYQPLCGGARDAGIERDGYFLGMVGKSFRFSDRDGLAGVVKQTLEAGDGSARLAAVGCAPGAAEPDCQRLAVLSYDMGNGVALILLTSRPASGERAVTGARLWTTAAPEVLGGTTVLGQDGLPYNGSVTFFPLALK